MNRSDLSYAVTLLCGVAMAVGIVGIVVPALPGLVLCWAGVLVWAIFSDAGPGRWFVLAVATAIVLGGVVVKYAWPGRSLKRGGVPNRSLVAGGLLGLVGFFVIPVVGLIVGFVAGVFVAELARLHDHRRAWPSTRQTLKAAGMSMMVEMAAGLATAATWIAGLVLLG